MSHRTRRSPLTVLALEDRSVPSAAPADFAPDSILVRLKAGAPQALKAVAPGAELDRPLGLVDGLWEVRLAPGRSVASALTAARANPFVAYAEPNHVLRLADLPTDPRYTDGTLWGLHNTGQVVGSSTGTPDADIDAPEAWGRLPAPADVVVAVIDTGVDYTHEDLDEALWHNPGETAGNGLDDDGNGFIDDVFGADFVNNDGNPMDDNDHGTHVSGTIAGEWNETGVAGVAPTAKIMALKVFDSGGYGTAATAIRALEYAVLHGARVSNHSYMFSPAQSQSFPAALAAAGAQGHLVAAAAGNGNFFGQAVNLDSSPVYPAGATPTPDNVISVAATNNRDVFASWSNYGARNVDLAAPGVDVYSSLPGDAYGYGSGTSMATPHVAGAAALVWAADPGLTMTEVRNQLLSAADPIGHLNPTRPTVTNGRLNVGDAVPSAAGLPRLSIDDVSAAEGNSGTTTLTFTVTRSGDVTGASAVNVATVNRTAAAGTDYAAVPLTEVTFGSGETTRTVTVTVNGDAGLEADETFAVRLTKARGAIVADWEGVGTIANDDAAPAVSITDVSVAEGRSGKKTFTFTVTLSAPSSVPVTVSFATANGTAAAGSDYVAKSGSVTFNPGETTKTIAITVNGDRTREDNETFFVNLSNPTGGVTLADAQGIGTILNDD